MSHDMKNPNMELFIKELLVITNKTNILCPENMGKML